MQFLDLLLLRLLLWIGLPTLLVALAVGPRRLGRILQRGWNWLFRKRLDPEEILTQVVRQHQEHVAAVRRVLSQAEATEAEIQRSVRTSQDNVAALQEEAHGMTARGDELGIRGALYKLNLEQMAMKSFQEQLERQRNLIGESRRRLYLLELQLRQYEVGRSILLSQLAQAEKVEQQYTIARQFDPFNAVANWQKAEGMVQEKALNARAIERVFVDTSDLDAAGQPPQIDPALVDSQLKELRALLGPAETQSGDAPLDEQERRKSKDKER